MIQPHWVYRDFVHWKKYSFLVPNLHRRINDELPSGSYRLRGGHVRMLRCFNKKTK